MDRQPQDQDEPAQADLIPQLDVETAAERVRQGAVLVDVREPDEFDEVHAEGAVLIPLGDVPERRGEIPPDQDTLLICRSGARSQRAAEYLAGPRPSGGERGGRDAGLGRAGPARRQGR